MPDCIFCKIIKKEIPASIVYEDADFVAFLDIKPINLGHTLLIPKNHYQNLYDTDDEVLAKAGPLLKKISTAVKAATNADGVNIGINNDAAAGQLIFHTHIHIIPRFTDDGLKAWDRTVECSPTQISATAEAIKNNL